MFYLFHMEHDFFKAFTLCGRWVVTNCSIQDENEHISVVELDDIVRQDFQDVHALLKIYKISGIPHKRENLS